MKRFYIEIFSEYFFFMGNTAVQHRRAIGSFSAKLSSPHWSPRTSGTFWPAKWMRFMLLCLSIVLVFGVSSSSSGKWIYLVKHFNMILIPGFCTLNVSLGSASKTTARTCPPWRLWPCSPPCYTSPRT